MHFLKKIRRTAAVLCAGLTCMSMVSPALAEEADPADAAQTEESVQSDGAQAEESAQSGETQTEESGRTLRYEDDSIEVTAEFAAGEQIPEGTRLLVTPVTDQSPDYNYDAYMQALNDYENDKAQEEPQTQTIDGEKLSLVSGEDLYTQDNTLLYDIRFCYDQTGSDGSVQTVDFEPEEGSVCVTMHLREDQLSDQIGAQDAGSVEIVHMPADEEQAAELSPDDVEVQTVEDPDVDLTGQDQVSFQADSFSVYGLVVKAKGIDVSEHNGDIDWDKVRQEGITFAFIRVGGRYYGKSGSIYDDDNFEKNVQGALAAGIRVGVYFYSAAVTKDEAVEEADYTLDKIRGYDITYPVVCDYEELYTHNGYHPRTQYLSPQEHTDCVTAFMDHIKDQGYETALYCSKGFLNDDYFEMERLASYKTWLAQYNDEVTYEGYYDYWQKSASGSVDGIGSGVDVDYEYGLSQDILDRYGDTLPEGTFLIAGAADPEYVLDISGESAGDGAAVQLCSRNGGQAQIFKISAVRDGYYQIINESSGMALEVESSSQEAGAAIIQSAADGMARQLWRAHKNEDGSYTLMAACSGKVLCAADDSGIEQAEDDGSLSEHFLLESAAASLKEVNGALYYYQGGSVCTDMNGLTLVDGDLWYLEKGRVRTDYRGLKKIGQIWYNFSGGRVVTGSPRLVKLGTTWWYVDSDGKVDKSFYGLQQLGAAQWLCIGGRVRKDISGLVKIGQDWYHISGGRLIQEKTLVKLGTTWWYAGSDGKVDKSFQGLQQLGTTLWYCRYGRVQFGAYISRYSWNGNVYRIRGGRAQRL